MFFPGVHIYFVNRSDKHVGRRGSILTALFPSARKKTILNSKDWLNLHISQQVQLIFSKYWKFKKVQSFSIFVTNFFSTPRQTKLYNLIPGRKGGKYRSTPEKTYTCGFSEVVLSCYYNGYFISTLNLPSLPFTGEFVSNSVRGRSVQQFLLNLR